MYSSRSKTSVSWSNHGLSIRKPPSPPIGVDRLLRTLCGFASCPFPRKSFATTLDGRLNFYSPLRRPHSTRPGSGTVPYMYMGAEPGGPYLSSSTNFLERRVCEVPPAPVQTVQEHRAI